MTVTLPPTPEAPFKDGLPAGSKIWNGIYTLSSARGHATLKVHTVLDPEHPLFGKRIVSRLVGRDNLFDYKGIGFLEVVEGKDAVKIWKRQQGTEGAKVVDAWFQVITEKDPEKWKDYRLDEARNCLRCNRTLTTPESIERGIGPVCDER